jgi:hypothetical protein
MGRTLYSLLALPWDVGLMPHSLCLLTQDPHQDSLGPVGPVQLS